MVVVVIADILDQAASVEQVIVVFHSFSQIFARIACFLPVGAGLDFFVVDFYAVVEVDGDAGEGDVAETIVVVFALF